MKPATELQSVANSDDEPLGFWYIHDYLVWRERLGLCRTEEQDELLERMYNNALDCGWMIDFSGSDFRSI